MAENYSKALTGEKQTALIFGIRFSPEPVFDESVELAQRSYMGKSAPNKMRCKVKPQFWHEA